MFMSSLPKNQQKGIAAVVAKREHLYYPARAILRLASPHLLGTSNPLLNTPSL